MSNLSSRPSRYIPGPWNNTYNTQGPVQNRVMRSVTSLQNITTAPPAENDLNYLQVHTLAKTQLATQMQKRQANSIHVDHRDTFLFLKRNVGRVCSCLDQNSMAEGMCQVCFRTGFVGGFDKWGCHTEILDYTYPNVATLNVQADYSKRPTVFNLDKNASFGQIYWSIDLRQNTRVLDTLQIVDYQPQGTSIQYFVYSNNAWAPLTIANLQAALKYTQIQIRADISRLNLQLPSPVFSNIFLRYALRCQLLVEVQFQNFKDDRALSDYGIFNQFQPYIIHVSHVIPNLQPEDFFYYIDKNLRFKCTASERKDPFEVNLGFEATIRLVQKDLDKAYNSFPVESLNYTHGIW